MSDPVYAISSDLTGEAYAAVVGLWELLEDCFGIRAARAAQHRHLTYVVGECAHAETLDRMIEAAAREITPQTVKVDGLGVFQHERPVVYLKVTNRDELAPIQRRTEQLAVEAGMEVWPYYLEDAWIPHITLALQDLDPDRLSAV